MKCLILLSVAVFIISVGGHNTIEKEILKYFESEIVSSFAKQWQNLRKPFESAIKLALKETYAPRDMNIYTKRMNLGRNLCKGFFLSDNIVDILLLNMVIREMPHINFPEVTFSLDGNSIIIQGILSKLFIESEYLLFRNHSDIFFVGAQQDTYKHSPFSFHQVQTMGHLSIIAEDCHLVGTSIATLFGQTINLGHNSFRVIDCRFNIEIYTLGMASPPVMAPYFNKFQSIQLERLLWRPISSEMIPKLQGTLFSYMNTTAMFGPDLPKFRHHQSKIFKQTSYFMERVVTHLNSLTIAKNGGKIQLNDFKMVWDEKKTRPGDVTIVGITNLILHGIDTAYSAHNGGPFKMGSAIKIAEEIRFNTMQLHGQLFFKNGTTDSTLEVAAEIQDVNVAVTINVDVHEKPLTNKETTRSVNRFHIVGWRLTDYSLTKLDLYIRDRVASHALISGYLINEVPSKLIDHLADVFPKAVAKTDKDSSGVDTLNVPDNLEDHDELKFKKVLKLMTPKP